MSKKKENHDGRTNFQARFNKTIINVFNQVSSENPDFTDREIVNFICEKFLEKETDNSKDLQEKIDELEKTIVTLESNIKLKSERIVELEKESTKTTPEDQQTIEVLNAEKTRLDQEIVGLLNQIEELKNKNATIQEQSNENARLVTQLQLAESNPKEGVFLVEPGLITYKVLEMNLHRLQEKGVEISANDFISDLLTKYIIEQPAEFASPILVSTSEVKQIIKDNS